MPESRDLPKQWCETDQVTVRGGRGGGSSCPQWGPREKKEVKGRVNDSSQERREG